MKPTSISMMLAFALVVTAPKVLIANGFRLVSQDAFAAARGEAFAATADNPSAIHYNPAGLTQLDGQHVRLGTYALYFNPTFRPPAGAPNAGAKYEIETKFAFAPQLYYTCGLPDSPLSLGLGVYSPHGASVSWPETTGFRAVATEAELIYLRINPVLAVEVLPGLSLAAGLMVDHGDIEFEQGLLPTSRPFTNSFRFDGNDTSAAFNLGVLWEINEQFKLGATFRSATTLDFKGRTQFEQQPFIGFTQLPAKAEFEFPYTAVVGLSYRPNEQWNFEFNADFTNWSSIDRVTIRQFGIPPFPVQQAVPVTLLFKDSWILKLGATRYFGDGWHASAGYLFNENSVPADFYSPTVADLDRHFLTFGVGREWGDCRFDVSCQFGYGPERQVRGSSPPSTPGRFVGQNADGTYDFVSLGLLVSFGMRF